MGPVDCQAHSKSSRSNHILDPILFSSQATTPYHHTHHMHENQSLCMEASVNLCLKHHPRISVPFPTCYFGGVSNREESALVAPKCNAREEQPCIHRPLFPSLVRPSSHLGLDGVLALREVHRLLLLLLGDLAGLVRREASPPGAGFLGLRHVLVLC